MRILCVDILTVGLPMHLMHGIFHMCYAHFVPGDSHGGFANAFNAWTNTPGLRAFFSRIKCALCMCAFPRWVCPAFNAWVLEHALCAFFPHIKCAFRRRGFLRWCAFYHAFRTWEFPPWVCPYILQVYYHIYNMCICSHL